MSSPQQPPAGAAGISQEKQGDQRHQCGEAAVAGDQGIGQLGREPLPGGVDNAAAGDTAGVAAEAHAHGQALPAVTAAAAHKGHPGQVAGVLQQREQGEENGHGRQHHRYHPSGGAVQAIGHKALKPGRCAQGGKAAPKGLQQGK